MSLFRKKAYLITVDPNFVMKEMLTTAVDTFKRLGVKVQLVYVQNKKFTIDIFEI